MSDDFISEGLLREYLSSDEEFSQFTVRLTHEDASAELFYYGIVMILVGGFSGAIYLLPKRYTIRRYRIREKYFFYSGKKRN